MIEVGETATLAAFVAAGLGLALVPASVQALQLDGVVHLSLTGEPETVALALARRASLPRDAEGGFSPHRPGWVI